MVDMAVIALEIGLNVAGARGIDAYYRGLLNGLARVDQENRYLVFAHFWRDYEAKLARLQIPERENFVAAVKRWPDSAVERLERRLGLPVIDRLFARPSKVALYHALGGRLPRLSRAKSVVTVHDLIPEVLHERGLGGPASGVSGEAARRADRVIAISKSTKNDLVRFYGVDASKIEVVHYGMDHDLFKPIDEPAILRKHGIAGPYWLLLGPFELRRNHERALEALARAGGGETLVFAGSRGAYSQRLEAEARRLGLAGRLVFAGHVPREDMPALYSGARGLLHPTLYEGFCLPVLEAMACGTPVVASNASSLPEVVGDAALTADPESVDAIAAAVAALASESKRRELREKGIARAAGFTWDEAARRTKAVYSSLLGG